MHRGEGRSGKAAFHPAFDRRKDRPFAESHQCAVSGAFRQGTEGQISPERKKQLNQNLMMFFTGFTRFSSDVQKANAAGKQDKTAQLKEMLALVNDAERVLTDKNADLDDFGRMLDHTWRLKRQTGSAVSTNSIDVL